jgi:hypothetical protein
MVSLNKKNDRSLFSSGEESKAIQDEQRENKETTIKIFLECFKKSCSETTAHGIPNIGN